MRFISKSFCFLIFGVFTLLITTGQLVAQNQRGPLHLATGDLLPESNAKGLDYAPDWATSQTFEGKTVCILQFYSIPNNQIKTELEKAGVQLVQYIPENAWVAVFPEMRDWSIFQSLNIRSVFHLSPWQKTHISLQERPLPAWTLIEPGKADLRMSFFNVFSESDVKAELIQAGAEIVPDRLHIPNSFIVRVRPEQINTIAALPFLAYLEPIAPPSYPENYTGRSLHRSNYIDGAWAGSRKYDGSGVVIAMGDDGIIGPHIDYQGRTDQSRVSQDNGDHGDHIAGTIMGAGNLDPKEKGMAPGAELHPYQVWDAVFDSPTSHIADGVMITSTSYSNGCNGGYTTWAASADQMIRENPSLMHVFSAGNSGTEDCGYGAGTGWGNVTGGIKIGKNVLCVGNVTFSDGLAGSSSRGPTADGRIKPDLCAKGTSVNSTIAGNQYDSFTGTSMSCPGVSGTLAQLVHAYRTLNNGMDPESALLKGIMMNTCDDLGNPGPDFKFGYGRINALRAVEALENQTWFTDTISQGASRTHTLTVPAGTGELRVMLYWTDWEGPIGSSAPLINDLDLTVVQGTSTFQPWILNPAPSPVSLDAPATRGVDHKNNTEQVTIEAPAQGTWNFTIDGYTVPQGPQRYYLVYELRDSSITVTWPAGGEPLVPGEVEKIRWDSWGEHGSFEVEFSADNGNTWTSIGQNVSGTQRYFDWQVPDTLTAEGMIRVSRAGETDASDAGFSILKVPNNLEVAEACPQYHVLEWDSVPGAVEYEVFTLGNQYMDSIGVTTGTTFTVSGVDQFNEYWYAVRALGSNGEKGRRTVAHRKDPGIWNCTVPNDIAVDSVAFPDQATYLNCLDLSQSNVTIKLVNHSPNVLSQIPVYYQINGQAVQSETFPGPLSGYGDTLFTFSVAEDLSTAGTYALKVWSALGPDVNQVNDSISSSFTVLNSSTKTITYTQDFDLFSTCNKFAGCGYNCSLDDGWINVENGTLDAIDWRSNNGSTVTGGTGPTFDHTQGTITGQYLFMNSRSCNSQEARLISPCIDLGTVQDPEVAFWFHHYGVDCGELHLDLFADGVWHADITQLIQTEWGNKWWERRVDLTPWAGQVIYLRWRGITGSEGDRSDMALDDIQIRSAITSREPQLGDQTLSVYPNPNTGTFRVELENNTNTTVHLSVMDLQGRQVYSDSFQGDQYEVNLNTLPAGMYQLKVQTGANSFLRKLVIAR